jgi:hypothetical protein
VERRDFQELAALRVKEARLLFKANCPEGVYYMGGYAAECALKSCIAKRTKRHEFPDRDRVWDSHTHNLETLIRLADRERMGKENRRYERASRTDAEELLRALSERRQGLLQWLRQSW